jgi:carbonic anhydrase
MTIELDPRREAFAQGVASGLSQAEAYRRANPRSLKWKPSTVHAKGSETAAEEKVSRRIAELRRQTSAAIQWTREDSLRVLSEIAQGEAANRDKVAAVKELNTMGGFNEPARLDLTNSDGSLTPQMIVIQGVKVGR